MSPSLSFLHIYVFLITSVVAFLHIYVFSILFRTLGTCLCAEKVPTGVCWCLVMRSNLLPSFNIICVLILDWDPMMQLIMVSSALHSFDAFIFAAFGV